MAAVRVLAYIYLMLPRNKTGQIFRYLANKFQQEFDVQVTVHRDKFLQ